MCGYFYISLLLLMGVGTRVLFKLASIPTCCDYKYTIVVKLGNDFNRSKNSTLIEFVLPSFYIYKFYWFTI
jgi:hypothetical protein